MALRFPQKQCAAWLRLTVSGLVLAQTTIAATVISEFISTMPNSSLLHTANAQDTMVKLNSDRKIEKQTMSNYQRHRLAKGDPPLVSR